MSTAFTSASTTPRRQIVQDTSDSVKVTGQLFMFELQTAIFEVKFYDSTNNDEVKRTETWVAQGQPIINFVQENAIGVTRLDVLKDVARDLVQTVETNPTLKQSLQDDGDLFISAMTLEEMVGVALTSPK